MNVDIHFTKVFLGFFLDNDLQISILYSILSYKIQLIFLASCCFPKNAFAFYFLFFKSIYKTNVLLILIFFFQNILWTHSHLQYFSIYYILYIIFEEGKFSELHFSFSHLTLIQSKWIKVKNILSATILKECIPSVLCLLYWVF